MTNPPIRSLTATQRTLLDLLPLAAFFVGYRFGDLMTATALIMAATALSLIICYIVERKVALNPLITGAVVGVFGGLTLALNDELFIKMKPTIINSLFAAVLLVGVYGFRKGLLRHIFGMALELKEEGWLRLSARWGFFFLFLALLNEVIWRNFSTDFWVNFKVFGMLSCTIIFTAAQLPLIKRYSDLK